jgi:integrase
MPSIRQRGNTYQITVSCGYSSDGKKVLKTTTWTPPDGLTPSKLEKALHQVADEYEKKVQTGQCVDDNITLSEYTAKWLSEYAEKHLEETTLYSYRMAIESKILPALGHIKLGKLQPVKILSFLNNLLEDGVRQDGKKGGYSNRTVKYQHQILSSMLQQAVYWQIIPSNPCERVKPPTIKDAGAGKIKHFTEEQAIHFLDALQGEDTKYQLLAYIGLFGGTRKGEMLGLTWDDVDYEKGTLNIDKAGTYTPEKGLFVKGTKNSGSNRSVSLPESVCALLRQHKREQSEQRLQLGTQWQNNNLVFTQWNGLQMHTSTPRQWMSKFIKRYNEGVIQNSSLSKQEKDTLLLPAIPFHGLRHTSATLLIAGNTDIRTVSSRLGHSQVSTTMNIYSHALQNSDRKAVDMLQNMLGKKPIGQEKHIDS